MDILHWNIVDSVLSMEGEFCEYTHVCGCVGVIFTADAFLEIGAPDGWTDR
jgi:hypothetical protein